MKITPSADSAFRYKHALADFLYRNIALRREIMDHGSYGEFKYNVRAVLAVAELPVAVTPVFRRKSFLEFKLLKRAYIGNAFGINASAFAAGCSRRTQALQIRIKSHGAFAAVSGRSFDFDIVDEHKTIMLH